MISANAGWAWSARQPSLAAASKFRYKSFRLGACEEKQFPRDVGDGDRRAAGLDQVDVGGDESAQPAQVSRDAGNEVGGLPRHGTGAPAGPIARSKTGEHDPAIPRSMSFCDTCVAPRYSNGPASGRRNTGAEAFELEGMDPCYIDIDGFWSKDADIKSPESAPIAN
jgi:hypothetical protein